MYQFSIFAPNDPKIITQIIKTATEAGAGIIGNYSHCAFVSTGYGTWYSLAGSNPTVGKVGELSKEEMIKIEMRCPEGKIKKISDAVRKVHPFEEPEIIAVKIEVL